MVYYRGNSLAEPKKDFAIHDQELHLLIQEAEKRYKDFLFDAWMGNRKSDLDTQIAKLTEDCTAWMDTLPTKHKPAAMLPILLAEYLKKDIYSRD